MKKYVFLIFMLFLSLFSIAAEVEIDGINYEVVPKGKVAYVTAKATKYSGAITIPDKVMYEDVNYDVTKILDGAFTYCAGLTSITIANSVTSIGENAFNGCSGLTTVSIGSGVNTIGKRAFFECTSLTTISIPDNVTTMADYVFAGCTKLESVTLSKNLTVIDNYLFHNCGSLSAITIPTSVTKIGDYAFQKCKALTSLTIPASVTTIGNSAFNECSGLTSMIIPASVTTVGNGIFNNCTNLASVTYSNSLTVIPNSAFAGCSSLASFTIPASVTWIAGSAFSGCTSLTSITIPGTVTEIWSAAFNECTGLTTVTMEEGVKIIYGMTFRNCANLATVNIPKTVTKIDNEAFLNCKSLSSIVLPNSLTTLGSRVFSGCSGMTSLTIGTGLNLIEPYTFEGCSNLTSVTIPGNVTQILSSAFRNCSSLATLTLSEGLTEIGNNAFQACSKLTTLTIPNSVQYIHTGAFMECTKLTTVRIGTGIYSIGSLSFSSCEALEDVYIYAEEVPGTNKDAFTDSYPEFITLHVPEGCVDAYKAEEPWDTFKGVVAINSVSVYLKNNKLAYCSDKNLDFSDREDVKAFVVTGYDYQGETSTIWLTRVKDVPAGTPIIVKGTAGTTYEIPVKASSSSYYENMLKGNTTGSAITLNPTEGDYMNMVMQGGQFWTFESPISFPANMSYLQLPKPEAMPSATPGSSQTVKINNDKGKVTLCSTVDLDFSSLEGDGVKAFIVTGYDNSSSVIWLTRVTRASAGVGLIVKGPKGEYSVPSSGAQTSYANMLVGNNSGSSVSLAPSDATYTYMVMNKGEFWSFDSSIDFPSGMAYLRIPKAALAMTRSAKDDTPSSSYRFTDEPEVISMTIDTRSISGEGDTTGIHEAKRERVDREEWYTLQGQRVAKPGKGLYIRNGKKVVIK